MIGKLLGFALKDIARSKWVLLYVFFFVLLTEGLLRFTAGEAKTVVGLMNIVLLLIPLGASMFGTLHLHNSREFIELILTQPVRRSSVFVALWLGVVIPFLAAFTLGVGIPMAAHGLITDPTIIALLVSGNVLTIVFFALSFFVGIVIADKAMSMGVAFVMWLFFAVLYDGIILWVSVQYADYPLEEATIAMVVLNPVDLARIVVTLTSDHAALMGYTGAVFNQFFGTMRGILISAGSLMLWTAVPLWFAKRAFDKRDW